jgi:hypothetical protein
MKNRRRLIPITAVAALVAATIPLTLAIAPGAFADAAAAGSPQATASVVRVDHYRAPRKKVIHRKFRPWAHPTPGQVREIIRNEARRWGVSAASLSRRVNCESRFRWSATNGQYQGVLQFSANAFYRGLHTIRTHRVKIVRTKSRRVHDARITHYSDGRQVRRRTTPRRQHVTVIYNGRLPRHPGIGNAFAQIRIGAQALRGISAVHSSEWACGA